MTPLLLALTLTFTAPGDDGSIGNVVPPGHYDAAFSADTASIKAGGGGAVQMPAVAPVGTQQSVTFTPSGSGWFGMRTSDEAGNWSPWTFWRYDEPPPAVLPAPPKAVTIERQEP